MTIAQRLSTVTHNDRIPSILQNLEQVYAELDEEQKKWSAVSPFHCPPGCGRCCEHFIPDVWEIEALYIAAQFLIEGRDDALLSSTFSNAFACPLFRTEGEFHCTVYETRPLVCRVFGFAGDRDKRGNLRFAPCRFMAVKEGNWKEESLLQKMWTKKELSIYFPVLPPDMTIYARKVQAIDPSWAIELESLVTALPKAVKKLRLDSWFSSPDHAA
ncbi:MAG: YkgJ family cysteine cluster protein [Spirochaetes bacterium]|nr:YkgJ family cysteine cluster protein [Spirochaetota bacterium]